MYDDDVFHGSDFDEEGNTSSEYFAPDSNSDGEHTDKGENYMLTIKQYGWRAEKEKRDCTPPYFINHAALYVSIGSNRTIEAFEALFPDELVNLIIRETNTVSIDLPPDLREKYRWKNIKYSDIKVLAAMLLAENDGGLEQELRGTSLIFDISRTTLIYKLLSFGSDPDATGPLEIAAPIIKIVRKNFQRVYTPRQKVVIDERITFVNKKACSTRNQHAIGTCVLADVGCGYVYNFVLRIAKPMHNKRHFESGYRLRTIHDLMEPLYGKGYQLYSMNFFNSLELPLYMHQKRTGFVGALRPILRNLPKDLKKKKLRRGESDVRYERDGRMMVMKYNYRHNAYLVSSIHCAGEFTQKTKNGRKFNIPKLVADYEAADKNLHNVNLFMASAPFEQNHYAVTPRRIFRHLVNMIFENSFRLYKHHNGEYGIDQYRHFLLRALGEKYLDKLSTEEILARFAEEEKSWKRN